MFGHWLSEETHFAFFDRPISVVYEGSYDHGDITEFQNCGPRTAGEFRRAGNGGFKGRRRGRETRAERERRGRERER